MIGNITLALSVIITAYLLGSIPSAYIVGRLLKGLDMLEVGDGRMGAAATLRQVGFWGMVMVGLMDVSKGIIAVVLSQTLGMPLYVTVIAAIMAVTGHNWSIFLRLQGGKGALTTYGVLLSLVFWQFFIALGIGGAAFYSTHKTGLSTGVLLGSLSLINWLTGSPILITILPLIIAIPMVLKHTSTPKVYEPAEIDEDLQSKKV